jgi:hypothetical protein
MARRGSHPLRVVCVAGTEESGIIGSAAISNELGLSSLGEFLIEQTIDRNRADLRRSPAS